jgi:hypothetical protein
MKGCLLRLAVLLLLIFLTVMLFHFPGSGSSLETLEKNAPVGGILTGILLWFTWLFYLDLRKHKNQLRQLHSPVLREGSPLVVSGRIQSDMPAMNAPLSGNTCLGYHYEINHYTKMGSSTTKCMDYEGYALLPSVIVSKHGRFGILATPDSFFFSQIKSRNIKNALENAIMITSRTPFTQITPQQGYFVIDKKTGKTLDFEKNEYELIERTIQNSEEYLISGVYRANPPGITPDEHTILNPFKIIPGGERGLLGIIRNRWIGMAVCSTLITLIGLIHLL